VGKSSRFNALAGKRLAIVDDVAGVTRDRLSHLVHAEGRSFELVDTGGMGFDDPDNLTSQIEAQIEYAIDSATVIVFVVDVREGIVSLDLRVADRLRSAAAFVVVAANKADSPNLDAGVHEFHRLGFAELVATSARSDRGLEELLGKIIARLPADTAHSEGADEPVMKVAIVGRRNTGKSTFVNTLVQAPRMITSEVPGTTRDSVDVRFELDGKAFIAIDTPGLRRKKSITTDLDFYGLHRAERSIRRADVVLLFFDVSEPVSKVDKDLCDYVGDHFKPCIFVVNKWDLYAGKVATGEWADHLQVSFPTLDFVPVVFITGQTGKNVKALLNHAQMLFKQSRERVTTGELNRLLAAAWERSPPPLFHNRTPKLFFATQTDVQPPTLVLFVSDPRALSAGYRRYLLNQLRNTVPYSEVPIRLLVRHRHVSGGPTAEGSQSEERTGA
jgi:GTP-binding protein